MRICVICYLLLIWVMIQAAAFWIHCSFDITVESPLFCGTNVQGLFCGPQLTTLHSHKPFNLQKYCPINWIIYPLLSSTMKITSPWISIVTHEHWHTPPWIIINDYYCFIYKYITNLYEDGVFIQWKCHIYF
jgi:hypothetical protein